ncbi:hypothetical protein [Nocardia cyriacigeorgica]|uniref:hypothetical protein n=1 Tax=Nocardia cyriacigeorgica TaxID=135487 RepID=UPI0018950A2F|nr:hypothetical protein [Nocardia cyriacigeorgica]MBF6163027.1 hypothetical protein [Nocardia cyriacigeorgica]MBF6201995.1 hypothetical protein [Nocardia cyriacigeorgica]MBF6531979.1 hypothetical protein [Nocardia cyriacigeorgica]
MAIASVAIAALLPYLVLKVLWLSGSEIGMVPGSGPGHMQDTRMEIGNIITVVLTVIGVVVVLALTQPWGRRLPWWTLVVPAAAGTGALAPIALGLPIGATLQVATEGSTRSGGEGNLSGSVFAVVYGGFGVFGIALAILFADYVHRRWAALISTAPAPLRPPWARTLATAAVVLFAAVMIFWALARAPHGLAGWESLAQRVVLVVVALLALLGAAALLTPTGGPGLRWLTAWVGCTTAAVQGPLLLLLAHDATINPYLLAVTILATPAAAFLWLAAVHQTSRAGMT